MNKILIITLSICIIILGCLTFTGYSSSNYYKDRLIIANNKLVDKMREINTERDNNYNLSLQIEESTELVNTKNTEINNIKIKLDNLRENYSRITQGYGYIFNDPTYQDMKIFILNDSTDKNKYIPHVYECDDFATDIINNASRLKIRCAFVCIDFISTSHAIVAFNTTDKGIIFIEPQTDEEIDLKAGYFTTYNDIIMKYSIIW